MSAAREQRAPAEPYAWFWQDGSQSGVVTERVDYESHKARYPRMTFVPVYTHPEPAPPPEQASTPRAEPVAWLVRRRIRKGDPKVATYLFQSQQGAQYEYDGWLEHPGAEPELLPLYTLPPSTAPEASTPDEPTAVAALRASDFELYGQVTTHSQTGQQFFYRYPEPPYLDNASECIDVYARRAP